MQKLLNKISACSLIYIVMISQISFSQIPEKDKILIQNKPDYHIYYNRTKIEYMFAGKSAFMKFNPVSLFFGGMMYFYQSVISPQFSANCLYSPSCSYFSKYAISEFGLVKGICLSADRLTRCSRLGAVDIHQHCFDPETGKVHEHLDMFKIH